MGGIMDVLTVNYLFLVLISSFKHYLEVKNALQKYPAGEFSRRAAIWGGGVIFKTPSLSLFA